MVDERAHPHLPEQGNGWKDNPIAFFFFERVRDSTLPAPATNRQCAMPRTSPPIRSTNYCDRKFLAFGELPRLRERSFPFRSERPFRLSVSLTQADAGKPPSMILMS